MDEEQIRMNRKDKETYTTLLQQHLQVEEDPPFNIIFGNGHSVEPY